MFPIFEQGKGKGIGHSKVSFIERFSEICRKHLAEKRARAFAFIFYDFRDSDLQRILKDQGVFAKLDRLSGTELSIFYLHVGKRPNEGKRQAIEKFNEHFLSALGVTDKVGLPCIVFFKVRDDQINEVEIAQLESGDLIHGFQELYSAVEHYLAASPAAPASGSTALKWFTIGIKFLGIQMFSTALSRAFSAIV